MILAGAMGLCIEQNLHKIGVYGAIIGWPDWWVVGVGNRPPHRLKGRHV